MTDVKDSSREQVQALVEICRMQLAAADQETPDLFFDLDAQRERLLAQMPAQVSSDCADLLQELVGLTDALAAAAVAQQRKLGERLGRLHSQRKHRQAYTADGAQAGGYNAWG